MFENNFDSPHKHIPARTKASAMNENKNDTITSMLGPTHVQLMNNGPPNAEPRLTSTTLRSWPIGFIFARLMVSEDVARDGLGGVAEGVGVSLLGA